MNLSEQDFQEQSYQDLPEEPREYVRLPLSIFGKGPMFVMTADGEGFARAGVHTGDYIFFRKQQTAEPGQLAVVVLNGTVFMRRYYPEGGCIRLTTDDNRPDTIVKDCRIYGVAAKVVHHLEPPDEDGSNMATQESKS